MGFGLSDILGGIIKPVGDIIDSIHTSTEEKLSAKTKILEVQAALTAKAFEYEAVLVTESAQNVRAEANGHSWIQRNWRPLIMLMFGYIICHNFIIAPIVQSFGGSLMILEIPPDLWDLLKIGIGGYTLGRSAEKIVPAAVAALKKEK